MISDLDKRYVLPLVLDHYTSQMLTGHVDFNAQLYRFKLVNSPNCSCSVGNGRACAPKMQEDAAIQTTIDKDTT
ncbi:Reverse transcriptase domain-containing protein [Aphis craccivora]|uniref:Reverse transcriptase domain-containing protein n=1 Tax=Aphis craccivora TaxID=307492 RepID=A0A6G0Y6L5_APHCR|nr:Reverse transcriptase domain-containing protein [Aphis craccivora]